MANSYEFGHTPKASFVAHWRQPVMPGISIFHFNIFTTEKNINFEHFDCVGDYFTGLFVSQNEIRLTSDMNLLSLPKLLYPNWTVLIVHLLVGKAGKITLQHIHSVTDM